MPFIDCFRRSPFVSTYPASMPVSIEIPSSIDLTPYMAKLPFIIVKYKSGKILKRKS